MTKISAVLIVKNEEEMLPRCLESIKGVDEIIIVDTGSEDNTIEIAKKFTDKVFNDYTWNDNFAEARNHALAKATGDYILSIDADEYLHDFSVLRKTIEEQASKGTLAINCKLFAENNRVMHYFPRVFKRCPQVWWEGAVHNHVSVAASFDSEISITYGYSPAHNKDPNRAFRILQKEVERTDNGREIFYLGREYWYRRDFQNCVTTMGRYVQKSQYLAEKADAFLLMARCYWAMGMGNDARDACAQALICNSHFKEAILFMAQLAGDGSGNKDWQANADQWKRMAETADNRNVLFIK